MKQILMVVGVFFLIVSFAAVAAALESYQVTGPVLEVKDNSITVQKGKEKWEIARDKDTKVTGDLKVGSKVTIKYQMKATSIEAKGAAKK
jgi:cell division protein YceG involved in septum cleavage